MTNVTCRLTAEKPQTALCPTLVVIIKYGTNNSRNEGERSYSSEPVAESVKSKKEVLTVMTKNCYGFQ